MERKDLKLLFAVFSRTICHTKYSDHPLHGRGHCDYNYYILTNVYTMRLEDHEVYVVSAGVEVALVRL